MNIYRNKKTGATIKSACVIGGKKWERIEEAQNPFVEEETSEEETVEEEIFEEETAEEEAVEEAPAEKPKGSRRGKK